MSKQSTLDAAEVQVVCHRSQTERQRLAMLMMQLDMALALAREKGLCEVESYLEEALAKARQSRDRCCH